MHVVIATIAHKQGRKNEIHWDVLIGLFIKLILFLRIHGDVTIIVVNLDILGIVCALTEGPHLND